MAKCLLVILILAVQCQVKCCPVVNCGTTSPVVDGEPSKIMCYFVHDLRLVKTDFSIYHYADPTSAERPKTVLDCYYREENSTSPDCVTADGYVFNGEYGTTVALDIPKTSHSNDGNFVCQTTSNGFQRNRVCALHVKSKDKAGNIDKDSTTSCRTNTPVREGDPSFVECSFTEDPKSNRHYFNILRYDVDEEDDVPEVVLECAWYAMEAEPQCHVQKGYEFNHIIGAKLNLTIPKTTLSHAGKFACEDSPTLPDKMRCCKHEVIVAQASSTPPATRGPDAPKCVVNEQVVLGEPSSVTCLFPEDLNVNSKFVNVEHRDIRSDGTISPLKNQILHCSPNTNCVAAKGYEFHGEVQAKLTVNIPILKDSQLGNYACKVFQGNDEIQAQDCFLSLSKGQSTSTEIMNQINTSYLWIALLVVVIVLFVLIGYLKRKWVRGIVARLCKQPQEENDQNNSNPSGERVPLHQIDGGAADPLEATQLNGHVPNGQVEINMNNQ